MEKRISIATLDNLYDELIGAIKSKEGLEEERRHLMASIRHNYPFSKSSLNSYLAKQRSLEEFFSSLLEELKTYEERHEVMNLAYAYLEKEIASAKEALDGSLIHLELLSQARVLRFGSKGEVDAFSPREINLMRKEILGKKRHLVVTVTRYYELKEHFAAHRLKEGAVKK